MFSTIVNFIKNNPHFVIVAASAVFSIVVNIIIGVANKDKSKLKEALLDLPKVILMVEEISKVKPSTAIEKKAMAEAICHNRYGKAYIKNSKLFDDAIEDILTTPQKKGGFRRCIERK